MKEYFRESIPRGKRVYFPGAKSVYAETIRRLGGSGTRMAEP